MKPLYIISPICDPVLEISKESAIASAYDIIFLQRSQMMASLLQILPEESKTMTISSWAFSHAGVTDTIDYEL